MACHGCLLAAPGEVADEVANARTLQRPEWQRTAEVHCGNADAGRHQPVDDAFAKPRRQFRGQSMADDLLDEAVADGNGAGDSQMGNHIAHQFKHAQCSRPAAIEVGHGAHHAGGFEQHVEQVDDRTRANGGDD